MSRTEPVDTPKPLGAYSPLRVVPLGAAKLVFISGITAGNNAPHDTAAQAELIFARMGELLAAEGGSLAHVTKITTFLTDMRDYALYNAVRNRVFAGAPALPASATVGTTQLVRPEYRIEIEGIAFIPAA